MKRVQIADRWIGEGQPVFIVAETGTTCNGDVETALRMVDAAKEAGVDAVKFMVIGPEYLMSDRTVMYEYEWQGGRRSENMYDMLKKLQFRPEEWRQIRDYCRQRNLIFYVTSDYVYGVDVAEEVGVAAYKLSSWDAVNFPLIRRMAQTGKPIQIDAGPTTVGDLEKIMQTIRDEGNDQIILVHCSHAKTDDGLNIRSVPYMQQMFQVPTGYSADSRDAVPDLTAVALGTNLIEKRLTLDRSYPGHHHIKALEPAEFTEYVAMIRRAEQVLGEYAVKPSAEDLRQRELYFVSLVADVDIPTGTTITSDMLACKRPGTGISPELLDVVVGRKARRDIEHDEVLSWEVV